VRSKQISGFPRSPRTSEKTAGSVRRLFHMSAALAENERDVTSMSIRSELAEVMGRFTTGSVLKARHHLKRCSKGVGFAGSLVPHLCYPEQPQPRRLLVEGRAAVTWTDWRVTKPPSPQNRNKQVRGSRALSSAPEDNQVGTRSLSGLFTAWGRSLALRVRTMTWWLRGDDRPISVQA
jgi:hypothetical protein